MAENVDIVIGAKDQASATLNRVAGEVGGLSSSFASMGPTLVGIGAAVAGAVAAFVTIRGAILGVAEAASQIDDVSKAARSVGASVGDLQAFQFAMDEVGGIDPGRAIDALQKLQRAIGEIASGDNQAGADIFEKLQLDANELSLQSPTEQFRAIQQAIGGIQNASERAAAAQKIFGKGAADLLPVLMSTTEEFTSSMDAASALGATVGDEGAAAVEAMNDAVGRVSSGFGGLATQAAVALAPAVETVANVISSWLPPIIDAVSTYLPLAVDAFGYVADAATDAAASIGLMSRAEETFAERIEESRRRAAESAKQWEASRTAARNVAASVDQAKPSVAKTDDSFEKTIALLERQYDVAQLNEDIVREQEQLATARNEEERRRIELLQQQIAKQKELNAAEAAKDKEEIEQRETSRRLSNVPQATRAVESRLLTRGPSNRTQEEILATGKEHVRKQDETNQKLESIYQLEKSKGIMLEVVG